MLQKTACFHWISVPNAVELCLGLIHCIECVHRVFQCSGAVFIVCFGLRHCTGGCSSCVPMQWRRLKVCSRSGSQGTRCSSWNLCHHHVHHHHHQNRHHHHHPHPHHCIHAFAAQLAARSCVSGSAAAPQLTPAQQSLQLTLHTSISTTTTTTLQPHHTTHQHHHHHLPSAFSASMQPMQCPKLTHHHNRHKSHMPSAYSDFFLSTYTTLCSMFSHFLETVYEELWAFQFCPSLCFAPVTASEVICTFGQLKT